MRISHWILLLPVLAGPTFAQVSAPNCSSALAQGWNWTYNSLDQNPCYVAASLESTCRNGQFEIPALPPGSMYGGPYGGQGNTCICSTIVYSLVSACAGCQGSSWIEWDTWAYNCTAVDPPTQYPNPIPAGTSVPHWAYLNLTGTNGTWDALAAQNAGDSPEATPSPISTIQPSQTAQAPAASTSSSSPSKSPSHSGAIAGGVVGGIVGASLLVGVIFWYLRRRRSRAEARPTLYTDNAAEVSGTFNAPSPSIGKYYDPTDPTTFPQPLTSPTMSVIQTTHGSERGHGSGSIDTSHNKHQYSGLPIV